MACSVSLEMMVDWDPGSTTASMCTPSISTPRRTVGPTRSLIQRVFVVTACILPLSFSNRPYSLWRQHAANSSFSCSSVKFSDQVVLLPTSSMPTWLVGVVVVRPGDSCAAGFRDSLVKWPIWTQLWHAPLLC